MLWLRGAWRGRGARGSSQRGSHNQTCWEVLVQVPELAWKVEGASDSDLGSQKGLCTHVSTCACVFTRQVRSERAGGTLRDATVQMP